MFPIAFQRAVLKMLAEGSLSRPASSPTAPSRARSRKRQSPRQQRRGQALLLAVLLMVFAALLGSTFITIVALNLNQTARQENLSGARLSATAGLSFINDRLTNSAEGERWRWQRRHYID